MKVKTLALTALAVLALGSAAHAQDNNGDTGERRGGRGGMRHDPIERQMEALDLTADQKAKVQPILDQAKPKLEEIRRDAIQKTKAVMEETMSQVRPLLTPEQQTKLDQMKNRRNGGREGRRGDRQRGSGSDDADNG